MTCAFYVYAELADSDFPIAVFWDRQAALDFALTENNEAQAEYVRIEAVPLVDRWGFPCQIADLAMVAPWIV